MDTALTRGSEILRARSNNACSGLQPLKPALFGNTSALGGELGKERPDAPETRSTSNTARPPATPNERRETP